MDRKDYFCNPVAFSDGQRHTNPDPFILSWCGNYYCYSTDEAGVKVSCSNNLVDWDFLGYAISETGKRNYWAPSVLYMNGKFYMYYSNLEHLEDDEHKEWLKLAVSDRPDGPFVWKKTFFDKFSIDSHPVIWNKKLYMFYSVNDWIGNDEKVAGTIILMDEMISPEEFRGEPKPVILPSLEQEIYMKNRFGDGRDWYTLEGAATVRHGKRCFLTYSANAYVNVDYYVGTAVAECKTDFDDMEWKKYPSDDVCMALLKKNEKVEGTGHNTIAKAPNMVDDWIIYHGRMAEEQLIPDKEQREMRIDRLFYSGDRLMCMGPTQDDVLVPAKAYVSVKNKDISTQIWLAQVCRYYRAQFWISAKKNHTGCKFDIYLSWKNTGSYIKLCFNSGKKLIEAIECVGNIDRVIASQKIAADFDYAVPHLLSIERQKNTYRVNIDELIYMDFSTDVYMANEHSGVGICPYFTELTLHSFALTETMDLMGSDLIGMTENYKFTDKMIIDDNGIHSPMDIFSMENHMVSQHYTEEIQFVPLKSDNYISLVRDGEERKIIEYKEKSFSVYRFARGASIKYMIDGEFVEELEDNDLDNFTIRIKNMSISQYCFTKN